MKLAIILATLLAAAPASALTVKNDPGGSIPARAAQINALRASGEPVRIVGGYCNSACTMYLALPQTCVARGVSFGFHGALTNFGFPDANASAIMADHYPTPLAAWYLDGPQYVTDGAVKVRGAEMIRNGLARECDK